MPRRNLGGMEKNLSVSMVFVISEPAGVMLFFLSISFTIYDILSS